MTEVYVAGSSFQINEVYVDTWDGDVYFFGDVTCASSAALSQDVCHSLNEFILPFTPYSFLYFYHLLMCIC